MATNQPKVIISAEDRTGAALKSVQKNLKDLEEHFAGLDAIAGRIPGLGTALTAAFGSVSLTGLVKSTIDAADNLNDLSQRIGINVADLATWDLAARQSGTSLESVAKGVKGLSTYMVENGAALKAAGINATDANGALIELADLFEAMPDGIEKTNLAVKLFGKAGMDIIPMLNLGSAGLRDAADKAADYGRRMAELAPKADAFNDALEEMALQSREAGVNLGIYLIGPLASVVDFGTKAAMGIAQLGSSLAVVANDLLTFGQVAAAAASGGFTTEGQEFIKQKLDERRRFVEAANEDLVQRFNSFKSLRDRVDAAVNGAGSPKTGTDRGLGDKRGADGKAGKAARDFSPEDYAARIQQSVAAAITSSPVVKARELADQIAALDQLFFESGLDADIYTSALEKMTGMTSKAAKESDRLNELLAATPSAQLEKVRADMLLLADALEKGAISEQQFAEAVGVHYGKAGEKLGDLGEFAIEAARNMQDAMADGFFNLMQGKFDNLGDQFKATIDRMVANAMAARLGNYLLGDFGKTGEIGGAIGNSDFGKSIGGFVKGLFNFGGGKAEGGPLNPGKWYIAGERGPEPIWGGGPGAFAAGYGGQGGGSGGMTVVNQFTISAPADRRTQEQVAAMAGAGIRRAMARNG